MFRWYAENGVSPQLGFLPYTMLMVPNMWRSNFTPVMPTDSIMLAISRAVLNAWVEAGRYRYAERSPEMSARGGG